MENHSDAQPQGILKINYLITENDDRRAMNCFIDELFNTLYSKGKKGRLVTTIALIVTVVATFALVLLDGVSKHYLLVIIVVFLAAIVAGWRYINKSLLKIVNKGSIKARKNAGEYDVPTEAVFYEDKLTVTNGQKHGVVPWEEFSSAFENAEGLFLIHHQYVYFFIPARFFDRDSAEAVRLFVQKVLGEKFSVKTPMNAPDSSEKTGEIKEASSEDEATAFRFDFQMKGSDVTKISSLNIKKILAALLALFTLICVWFATLSALDGNYCRAAYTAIVYVILTAAGAAGFIKALRARGDTSKNISLNWCDDHVTVLVHREDPVINRVSYVKLKKIRRHNELTAVFFKDNTFLYVPRSAAKDSDEFHKWEVFIQEKLDKYSKL